MKIRRVSSLMSFTLGLGLCMSPVVMYGESHAFSLAGLLRYGKRCYQAFARVMRPAAVPQKGRVSVAMPEQDAKVPSMTSELCLVKNHLKPVPESAKNAFAKALASRRDRYEATQDLSSFISKLRIADTVVVKNEVPVAVRVNVSLERNKTIETQTKTIKPGQYLILEQHNGSRLASVTLETAGYYLNPKWTVDSHLNLVVQTQHDRHFLHQFHGFGFSSVPFTADEIQNAQSDEERVFKKSFNAHLGYIDSVLAPSEGLTLKGIDAHRGKLFEKNNITKLMEHNPDILDAYENKIPLITHKIWVTSDEKPVSLPNYYLEWFENSIKHNPVSAGWKHILWIESEEKLPELAQKLKNHPYITVKELKELPEPLVTGDLYKKSIQAKQFGKATDILRLEILRQFGGYYLDTDYELFQSLKPYSKAYDMVVAVEPMSAFLCNAFIGACPDHPVVNEGLALIKRNLTPETVPAYIKNNGDVGFKTIIETGPAVLTVAFARAGGKPGYVDIAMPPMLIYPTEANTYPYKNVVKPNSPIPPQAIGAHYWETAWMRAEFGSKG